MTRKDYILIAQAINSAREEVKFNMQGHPNAENVIGGANAGFWELAAVLAKQFEQDNPRFDTLKFREACGVITN